MIVLGGCYSGYQPSEQSNPTEKESRPTVVLPSATETLVTSLQSPWDIEKHENTFYISERKGHIVSWREGAEKTRLPVQTTKGIAQRGEGGLLGFKLASDFQDKKQAFVYHTYEQEGKLFNRVIIVEKQEGKWQEVDVLLEGIPGATYHNGGRLEIGPDEKLYVTAGDAGNKPSAQNIRQLSGKILRMNKDGTIPKDNPFEGSYVFSYGHRNAQGLAWSEEGQLYASEHGPDAHDEINKIERGKNYGWPVIQGDEQQQGMVTPIYQTGQQTWAPSGIAVKDNQMYIANLRGTAVRKMDLDNLKPEILINDFGRVRDVEVMDQSLYFITNNTDGRGNPGPKGDQLVKIPLPNGSA